MKCIVGELLPKHVDWLDLVTVLKGILHEPFPISQVHPVLVSLEDGGLLETSWDQANVSPFSHESLQVGCGCTTCTNTTQDVSDAWEVGE